MKEEKERGWVCGTLGRLGGDRGEESMAVRHSGVQPVLQSGNFLPRLPLPLLTPTLTQRSALHTANRSSRLGAAKRSPSVSALVW